MSETDNNLPPRDIPNFSAAFGKSPRSTIPKDKFLFEYLPQGNRVRIKVSRNSQHLRKLNKAKFTNIRN